MSDDITKIYWDFSQPKPSATASVKNESGQLVAGTRSRSFLSIQYDKDYPIIISTVDNRAARGNEGTKIPLALRLRHTRQMRREFMYSVGVPSRVKKVLQYIANLARRDRGNWWNGKPKTTGQHRLPENWLETTNGGKPVLQTGNKSLMGYYGFALKRLCGGGCGFLSRANGGNRGGDKWLTHP